MGNCLAYCRPSTGSCIEVIRASKHQKVLLVVKKDGKILEFRRPILVKDILANFSGSGIAVSEQGPDLLPPNYELKLGEVYYIVPSHRRLNSAVADYGGQDGDSGGVKRIKVVLTKHQLQQLLTKQVSVEEILLGFQKQSSCSDLDSPTNWTPKLETIPECCES